MNDEIDIQDHEPRYRCKRCQGTGQVPGIKKVLNMGSGMGSEYGPCPDCDGEGWITERAINPKPNSRL